jgi:hypothetical protein
VELLLENGADISAVPLAEVLLGWDPRIIRFFLDHRVDPITGSPFAVAFGSNCLAPVIECRQTHPELAPALNEQADRALRHFCDTGDMKWISLLMWGGADTLGPSAQVWRRNMQTSLNPTHRA